MYLIRVMYSSYFVRSIDCEGVCHTGDPHQAIAFEELIQAQAFCFALNSSLDLNDYFRVYDFNERSYPRKRKNK